METFQEDGVINLSQIECGVWVSSEICAYEAGCNTVSGLGSVFRDRENMTSVRASSPGRRYETEFVSKTVAFKPLGNLKGHGESHPTKRVLQVSRERRRM